MEKLTIVVGGFIGLYPSGGVTWDYIQYPIGLKDMGHDVYYIEDTGQYSNYRITDGLDWDDPYDTVQYLKRAMESFGFLDQWAYRDTFSRSTYGMSLEQIKEICSRADVFINISDSTVSRDEYLKIPRRVLIDSDPMFTQLQTLEPPVIDERYPVHKFQMSDYNYHFSFGENIGSEDCVIPELGIKWLPTRQPISMRCWNINNASQNNSSARRFTTIMNWSTRSKLKFMNQEWGQKDVEFKKFIDIPRKTSEAEFEVILAVSAAFKKDLNTSELEHHRWDVNTRTDIIADADRYRRYIQQSYGEFSIAKETYVKSKSGWFSCRSACYLAAAKPVITQETGWSKYIPAGTGCMSFWDYDSALEAIEDTCRNYELHSKAAQEIAREYFDSSKVLSPLIEKIF
jgi:hypothetical protein